MPRSRALNARMRAASRAGILRAALEVFAGRGYGGATIRMIAQRAGVSPGLIYAYFPGKASLLRALFARSMDDVRASFAAAEAEPVASRRLERLIRASFEILRTNLDFWRLSYGVRMQAEVMAGLEGALGAWRREIRRTLTRYLRAAGVPRAAIEARLLFALIDGVSQHYVLDPDRYPLAPVMDQIAGRYRVGGVMAPRGRRE